MTKDSVEIADRIASVFLERCSVFPCMGRGDVRLSVLGGKNECTLSEMFVNEGQLAEDSVGWAGSGIGGREFWDLGERFDRDSSWRRPESWRK